jgi:hypothetical protein
MPRTTLWTLKGLESGQARFESLFRLEEWLSAHARNGCKTAELERFYMSIVLDKRFCGDNAASVTLTPR